jgi:hypothetical protein
MSVILNRPVTENDVSKETLAFAQTLYETFASNMAELGTPAPSWYYLTPEQRGSACAAVLACRGYVDNVVDLRFGVLP